MITLKAAGYQGPNSIHSRGLAALASHLGAARPGLFDVAIENDITKSGRPARDLFGALDTGELQLCYMASGYLTARVPDLSVIDLPFRVDDRQRAYAAFDGAAGRILAERVQAATGFRVLGYWDNGFRHVSNRARPIRSVADCKGLIIRTLDSRVYQETSAAFGFVPKVTDVRDLMRDRDRRGRRAGKPADERHELQDLRAPSLCWSHRSSVRRGAAALPGVVVRPVAGGCGEGALRAASEAATPRSARLRDRGGRHRAGGLARCWRRRDRAARY